MNTESIRQLIAAKGVELDAVSPNRVQKFVRVLDNSNIRDYLTNCISRDGFRASGLSVKNLETLEMENLDEAAPGMYIYPYGYLVVATSVGGNALCFHAVTNRVYWANHGNFYDDQVSYRDVSGLWVDAAATSDNVEKAMALVDEDIETFLPKFLRDEFEDRLDALD